MCREDACVRFEMMGRAVQPSRYRNILRIRRELGMDFLKDLWGFLKNRKKFWLLPLILILLGFGALVVFAGGSAIAPFIYTLF
jgi:hypothetical protein